MNETNEQKKNKKRVKSFEKLWESIEIKSNETDHWLVVWPRKRRFNIDESVSNFNKLSDRS